MRERERERARKMNDNESQLINSTTRLKNELYAPYMANVGLVAGVDHHVSLEISCTRQKSTKG